MSLYYYINNESDSKSSINDYENIFYDYITRTPTLQEALMQMFTSSGLTQIKSNNLINEIINKVNMHLNKKFIEIRKKYPNITAEEAQIISSYTCELANKEDSNYNIYKILNRNLVSENRQMGIMVISKYLFIFLKSLRKLKRYYPDKQSKYLYRCISTQVELKYDPFNKSKIPYLRGLTKIFSNTMGVCKILHLTWMTLLTGGIDSLIKNFLSGSNNISSSLKTLNNFTSYPQTSPVNVKIVPILLFSWDPKKL